jgi:hypothetical protein
MRTRSIPVTFLLLVALTGCAGPAASPASSPTSPAASAATVFPIIASTDLGVGQNRFLFLLVGPQNRPISAPDRSVTLDFYPLAPEASPGSVPSGPPASSATGTFVWGIEGERGFYYANPTFATAGNWTAVFRTEAPDSPRQTLAHPFAVLETTSAVRVGQKAPAMKTPTLADVGGDIRQVSTDANPDSAFYVTSVDKALAEKKPFVIVFATPAFCKAVICGPTLEQVKKLAPNHPDVTFINVEPYRMEFKDGRLQPIVENDNFVPTDVTKEWGILSEPWVFVVDREGVIQGSFEATFGEQEMAEALAKVKS